MLRCRSDARRRFAALRQDVLVKMELLDQKHVQDIVFQLQRYVMLMARYHQDSAEVLEPTRNLFPIEVDLSQVWESVRRCHMCLHLYMRTQVAVKYNTTGQLPPADEDDEGEEAIEAVPQKFVDDARLIDANEADDHLMMQQHSSHNTATGDTSLLDLN
jgi:hypothetical protein